MYKHKPVELYGFNNDASANALCYYNDKSMVTAMVALSIHCTMHDCGIGM